MPTQSSKHKNSLSAAERRLLGKYVAKVKNGTISPFEKKTARGRKNLKQAKLIK